MAALVSAACGSSDSEETYLSTYYNEGAYEAFNGDEDLQLSVVFEATSSSLQHWGFVSTTQVHDRQYFFTTDNNAANLDLVYNWERIINKIGSLVDFETIPLEIFFYDDGAHYQRFDNGRNIFVNTAYSNNYLGRLVSHLNDMRLPIWLYIGLEAVARDYIGLYVPNTSNAIVPNFGDMSFAPMTWGTQEQTQAIATAYNFVVWLIEGNSLAELVRLYAAQETALANDMAAGLFYEFADKPMDTMLSLHFEGSLSFHGQEPRNVIYNYKITAYTDFGNYNFLFLEHSDALDIHTIKGYVYYFDDSARFVKDFFAEFAEFDFRPMDIFIVYNGSAFSAVDASPWDGWIRLFNFDSVPPSAIVHEIAHFVSFWSQDNEFGPFEFEEGIAMALERYHDIHDAFGKSYRWQREHGRSTFGAYANALLDIFNDEYIAQAAWYSLISDFDTIGLAHLIGYSWLYFRNYEARAAALGASIPEIGTHPTAGSFVLYLIENYGVKNYMKVHFGRSSFEDVYGITIYEAIVQWRMFLYEFILELGQEAQWR